MLGQVQLARLQLPVGAMTKAEVRDRAAALGLRTAAKPDSQDVCFIPRRGGRRSFLSDRFEMHPGRVLDEAGRDLGAVEAVELVTVGQRKGLVGSIGDRYVTSVDIGSGVVRVGPLARLLVDVIPVERASWVDDEPGPSERFDVQMSAHGSTVPGRWDGEGRVWLEEPVRRVAPGQSLVLYRGDRVAGGAVVSSEENVPDPG
jgi:tRNA-specific 2-thiouridylase